MRRFVVDAAQIAAGEAILSPEESRHITRVLRLAPGARLELLDGCGTAYLAEILSVGKTVRVQILDCQRQTAADEAPPLIIGQAILKGQKMDELVQRYTELGVTKLAPFWGSRCQGKFSQALEMTKFPRYQRIIAAACKQSSRLLPMQLIPALRFCDLLTAELAPPGAARLMFYEEERQTRLQSLPAMESSHGALLLLGPEGGFSVEEVAQARAAGWQTVSLGTTILRAETAALAAAAIMQFLLGRL